MPILYPCPLQLGHFMIFFEPLEQATGTNLLPLQFAHTSLRTITAPYAVRTGVGLRQS